MLQRTSKKFFCEQNLDYCWVKPSFWFSFSIGPMITNQLMIKTNTNMQWVFRNQKAWLLFAVIKLKVFPAPRYHLFVMKMASSRYFFELNSKMTSKNTLGHSLMTQNALSRLYPVYQIWQVSKMECAKQGVFLEGKIGKMPKKNFKNFYCPKSSKISYWSIIYL